MDKDNWYKEIGSVKRPIRTVLDEVENLKLPIPITEEAKTEYEKHLLELLRLCHKRAQFFFTQDPTNLFTDLSNFTDEELVDEEVSDEEFKKTQILNSLEAISLAIDNEVWFLQYCLGIISKEEFDMYFNHRVLPERMSKI